MEQTILICDVCSRQKGENNHWLISVVEPGEVGIAFGPIDSQVDNPNAKIEHICGDACALKRFSQFLGSLHPATPKGSTE